jgi:CRISPR-associated protein Cmr2
MSYLFQVSIGPVQSFIGGARRTRDLKFSSSFLSELAEAATSTISKKYGEESLLFPVILADGLEDVPNKILAYIKEDVSSETLKELALQIKAAIDARVRTFRDSVFQTIGQGRFDVVGAEQQIADLVEYIWAGVRYDEHTDNYAKSRQRLEALMAARKNTRDFTKVNWGSSQPKSSIDGLLESVILEDEYPPKWGRVEKASGETRGQLKNIYLQKARDLRAYFDAGPHEKLSGVDLLKRLGKINKEEQDFPSTSHIAVLPFLQGIARLPSEKQQKIAKLQGAYVAALEVIRTEIPFKLDRLPENYRGNSYWSDQDIFSLGDYDGALLFPERFPDVVGDAQVFQEARKSFQKAELHLQEFFDEVGFYPAPYYVLLVADGDSMGQVIDAQAQGNQGMKNHKALSEALAHFASSVREIIEKHEGVRIYSGGDDVLALLPLHEAVQCACKLAEAFYNELQTFTDGKRSPTLSVGLAVVHHLHPLGDALRIARDAEQHAKHIPGKNALAITVQKRGGSPCEVSGKWDVFEPRLEHQISLAQSEIIPSGMAYELREVALRLESEEDQKLKISPPYVQYAALRVFQRKLDEAGRQKHSKKEVALALYVLKRMIGLIGTTETPEKAFNALKQILEVKDEETERLDELRKAVSPLDQIQPARAEALANELVVARLFAEARLLAMGGVNSK